MSVDRSRSDRLGLLHLAARSTFTISVVVVAPGDDHTYVATEWCDALVEIDHGELNVEMRDASRCRFGCGDVLWLAGLPIRRLHNPGSEPTVLVVVSRRRSHEDITARRDDNHDDFSRRCRLNVHDDDAGDRGNH